MSYSLDANLLLYASDRSAKQHGKALSFLKERADDRDLMCLTWPALIAYQRIATHPSIFTSPLSPETAWQNIERLIRLPRARVLGEESDFWQAYKEVGEDICLRGNLVPDAHIATLLRQHGVKRIYTADTDFKKFPFLEAVNPL